MSQPTLKRTQVSPGIQVVHCLLRRENLTAQHLRPDLSAVIQEVVAVVVNFINQIQRS